MTPKAHALLASIASIKTAAADEYQFLMGKLDDVEHGRVMVAEVIASIRDGITRLSHSVISAHDTAAVLAEPMSLASVPAVEPVVDPVVAAPTTAGESASTDEPEKATARKASTQVVRNVPTRDDPDADAGAAMSRNGGKAEA